MINFRRCYLCSTDPCPYDTEEKFQQQLKVGGEKWQEEKPCWTPFPENIGKLHDKNGEWLQKESKPK